MSEFNPRLSPQWIATYCPLAIEDRGLHTRVTIISYQYSNTFGRGGDLTFRYRFFVRDAAGSLLIDRDIGVMQPNQIWQADLRGLLAEAGLSAQLPAGNLSLAARPAESDEVNALRIPQFEVDYYTDAGDWEAVHSKGFNPQYWYPTEFAFARVLESSTHTSFLAIQNLSLDTPARPVYTLLRADGDQRGGESPVIAPGGSALLPIGQVFGNAAVYLRGEPGALLIAPQGSRVLPYLFLQNRRTGAWSVDHYSMPV